MALPSVVLILVLASLYGCLFYLFVGRGWLALGVYWAAALVGFVFGEVVSRLLAVSLFPIGTVNVVEASLTSWIALLLTRTLWNSRAAR